jgi:uncharacterized pyridoxal phosphate-containing UPF0001 family protein
MAIPEPTDDIRGCSVRRFRQLRELRDELPPGACRSTRCRWACRTISKRPIAEGATMVRVGTAIFGERNYA